MVIIGMIVLGAGSAAGENFGPVRNLEVTTWHFPDMVTSESEIKMEWEHCDGEPAYYLVQFDTNPEHTFQYPEANDADYTPWTKTTSPDLSELNPDDEEFYFHVAANDAISEIGPTTTAGPFRIDTVPPRDVSVTAPEVTSSRSVTLTLASTNACLLRISESERYLKRRRQADPDIPTDWEILTFEEECGGILLLSAEEYEESGCRGIRTDTREWELSEGNGEKTVYVRFYDTAWNTTDASVVITLISGDADGDLSVGLADAVLVMQMLTGTDTTDINPDADINGDGKIGTEEVIFILREISGM